MQYAHEHGGCIDERPSHIGQAIGGAVGTLHAERAPHAHGMVIIECSLHIDIPAPAELSMRCVLLIYHGSREHGRTAETFGC